MRIECLLAGGLGNQLFQYAFARSLALRSGARLELDAATLFCRDRVYQRTFELNEFRLPEEVIVRSRPSRCFGLWRRWMIWRDCRREPLQRRLVAEKRPLGYYPEYRNWKVNQKVFLWGYWQCEQYFKDIEPILRRDLGFRKGIDPRREELRKRMEGKNSIAVHLRRVQYEPKLDIEYYRAGLENMRQRFTDARFFVFGDDLDFWHREGDNSEDVTIVDGHGFSGLDDFKLMTHCRHFIIANSSFSWWAAWIGNAAGKQVVAPAAQFWLNPETVPDDWEVVRGAEPVERAAESEGQRA